MADEKRVITLDDFELRLVIKGLTDFRNNALREGKPIEDLDDLILKMIDAPTLLTRTSLCLFSRKSKKCVQFATDLPSKESSDFAGIPWEKRRDNDEAR